MKHHKVKTRSFERGILCMSWRNDAQQGQSGKDMHPMIIGLGDAVNVVHIEYLRQLDRDLFVIKTEKRTMTPLIPVDMLGILSIVGICHFTAKPAGSGGRRNGHLA
jgi:hypothetical protein